MAWTPRQWKACAESRRKCQSESDALALPLIRICRGHMGLSLRDVAAVLDAARVPTAYTLTLQSRRRGRVYRWSAEAVRRLCSRHGVGAGMAPFGRIWRAHHDGGDQLRHT